MGIEDGVDLQQVVVEKVNGKQEVLLVVNPMNAEPGRLPTIK